MHHLPSFSSLGRLSTLQHGCSDYILPHLMNTCKKKLQEGETLAYVLNSLCSSAAYTPSHTETRLTIDSAFDPPLTTIGKYLQISTKSTRIFTNNPLYCIYTDDKVFKDRNTLYTNDICPRFLGIGGKFLYLGKYLHVERPIHQAFTTPLPWTGQSSDTALWNPSPSTVPICLQSL